MFKQATTTQIPLLDNPYTYTKPTTPFKQTNSQFITPLVKDIQLDLYSSSSTDSKQTTYEQSKFSGYNIYYTVGTVVIRSI